MKYIKGQALVETMFILPILAIVIFATAWFGNVFIIKQKLLIAARYGTDLILNSNFDSDSIRQEIKNSLCEKGVFGIHLDPSILSDERINVRIYREKTVSFVPIRSYGGNEVERYSSFVEIYYNIKTLNFMKPIIKEITISARSEVLAGTGAK